MNELAAHRPTPSRVYVDHAATTPTRPAALEAFVEASIFANPASLHAAGRRARSALDDAREEIAGLLGAHPSEVIFTSGGTESDNLGVLGAARAAEANARLLVTATEHHSVLDAAAQAQREGTALTMLPVARDGRLDMARLHDTVREAASPGASQSNSAAPLLAAIMLANNESGAINPVAEAAQVLSAHHATLHVDAVQAVGHIPVDFGALQATTLSMSGHKFGAPLGIGALLARRDSRLQPLGFGGGQERDLRSGTVNVPGAVAMAVALREAVAEMDKETARLVGLRDRLIAGIRAIVPEAILSGPEDPGGAVQRLPGNVHMVFPSRAGESLLMLLDSAGIDVSTGSACTAGVAEASHVLLAAGFSEADARSALRFTLGWTTTDDDIARILAAIGAAATRAGGGDVIKPRLRPGR